jgi:hypothetical protein
MPLKNTTIKKLTSRIKPILKKLPKIKLPSFTKTISVFGKIIHITSSVAFCIFSGIFVFFSVFAPPISLLSGESIAVNGHSDRQIIHELFPRSSWNDFEPCGLHFNEQEEFNKALQCVNTNVWKDSPIKDETVTHLPRCFIVKANSIDIYSRPDIGFNFVPEFIATPLGIQVGAIVGVYQPETRTVFIVENVDAPMIYRHELQHYFLHAHDPETGGGGHHQTIWEKCEPPYYTPSEKVQRNVVATPEPSEKKE